MRARIVGLVVSCLMVTALLVVSCAPTPTPTPILTPAPTLSPTPTPAQTPTGSEVPKYGGEFIGALPDPVSLFDDAYGTPSNALLTHLTNEKLGVGDWAKGPAGSNEYGFDLGGFWYNVEVGLLAESWEFPDVNTLVFHIQKGVHFALDPKSEASRLVGGREMTSDDVAFTITRQYQTVKSGYGASTYPGWFQSAKATDKYTVVVKCQETGDSKTSKVMEALRGQLHIVPREVVEKYGDMRNWENSVGTGQWILEDYVSGSAATLRKNPNYWRSDPLHPSNKLPYMDRLKWLVMPDPSTRIAALRTGRIYWLGEVKGKGKLSIEEGNSILRTNPELQARSGAGAYAWLMGMRTDNPKLPFYDVRVRRAMAMGIDRQAILRDYFGGEGELIVWPSSPNYLGFTPYEKLPPNIKETFDYQPDKAKALLAEAGYPNGFKTSIITPPDQDAIDLLSIVKNYWSKIGIDLTLDVKDATVQQSIRTARSHTEMFINSQGTASAYSMPTLNPVHFANSSMVNDPYINERRDQIWAFENITNQELKDKLLNEIHLRGLEMVYMIGLPCPNAYTLWQPWVQNYHGENSIGHLNDLTFVNYIWLDQDLKYAKTGRR